MLKTPVYAIMIIEDMCSNPYNNSWDRRIMKRGINQVEKDDSKIKLGKRIQALKLKIETLMRAQAQVPFIAPSFPTYDRCGIVHGLEECTIDDKLGATMVRSTLLEEEKFLKSIPQQFQSRTWL